MEPITIVKVGGKIVEDEVLLAQFLDKFSQIKGLKALIHGGGVLATKLATQLGISTQMVEGKRVTDKAMLNVVTMVYGGLVNKNIVANLQARGLNAIGLTGADMGVIQSKKRPIKTVDYGFVGDVEQVAGQRIVQLISLGILPIFAPLTYDVSGNILNTNADTIASEVAKSLANFYDVTLLFCFEKNGVLANIDDDSSIIPTITPELFEQYKNQGIIHDGMIPKLENAFEAIRAGVKKVVITRADAVSENVGTTIIA